MNFLLKISRLFLNARDKKRQPAVDQALLKLKAPFTTVTLNTDLTISSIRDRETGKRNSPSCKSFHTLDYLSCTRHSRSFIDSPPVSINSTIIKLEQRWRDDAVRHSTAKNLEFRRIIWRGLREQGSLIGTRQRQHNSRGLLDGAPTLCSIN